MPRFSWKATAIIFIILFVLETISFIYLINVGTREINNENECVLNVCSEDIYDSYYYDSLEHICYCYTDNEVTKTRYID